WHPEGGGSELYVQQVAARLVQTGIRVTVFSASYTGAARREERSGITFVRRGGHLTVYLWAAVYLLTRRFGRVDEVLEVQNGMPFLARLFTLAPVVVLVHHVHREQWPVVGRILARVGWLMESRVAVWVNRHGRYVAVSEVTRSELVGLGVDASRIAIAYNGLPPTPEFARQAPTSHPSLVVLSRLVPHKQIEHALHLVAELRHELPDLRLTVMGGGWWEQRLLDLRATLGLEDCVHFLGHVDERTKFEELSRSWVHVLLSIKEGWGLSIIEAARVGVPSVAYRSAGGVQESILEGVTGLLADSESDFVTRVRELLLNDTLRRDLGAKAEMRTEQLTWASATETIRNALRA
ncbi:MAG: glycosyltransferase family 4 protein, partial [Nocardioidaceae bacterium]